MEHRDFLCFWIAGHLAATGHDPYDAAAYQSALIASGLTPDQAFIQCGTRFPFPPWTTLAFTPFGALPIQPAAMAWLALFLAATALGMWWSWRVAGGGRALVALFAALVLASEPFLLALQNGQLSPFTLAFTSGALVLSARGRERAAGAALAGLLVKPQLVVIALPALLMRLRRTAFVALATIAVMAVASIAILPGSLDVLAGYATRRVGVTVPVASLWDLASSLGAPLLAPLLITSLIVVVFVLTRGRVIDGATFGGIATAISLAAAPYAWSYDYVPLALPWALTLARAARLRARWLVIAQVLVAAPLAWGLYLLAFARGSETLSPAVPAASAVLLALAVRADGLNDVSG